MERQYFKSFNDTITLTMGGKGWSFRIAEGARGDFFLNPTHVGISSMVSILTKEYPEWMAYERLLCRKKFGVKDGDFVMPYTGSLEGVNEQLARLYNIMNVEPEPESEFEFDTRTVKFYKDKLVIRTTMEVNVVTPSGTQPLVNKITIKGEEFKNIIKLIKRVDKQSNWVPRDLKDDIVAIPIPTGGTVSCCSNSYNVGSVTDPKILWYLDAAAGERQTDLHAALNKHYPEWMAYERLLAAHPPGTMPWADSIKGLQQQLERLALLINAASSLVKTTIGEWPAEISNNKIVVGCQSIEGDDVKALVELINKTYPDDIL